jgi:hypothetical protein
MLPQEVYDPKLRAAAEASNAGHPVVVTTAAVGASGLTGRQLWITVGFGAAVFAGTTALLFTYAGR